MPIEKNYNDALSFLNDKREEMTDLLLELCAINSGSTNLSGLEAMRLKLMEVFQGIDAHIEHVPSLPHQFITNDGEKIEKPVGDMLRITRNMQAPVKVLLAGHMDTVFPADHPFQTHDYLDEDTLRAPGGADMKGGLLVMLYALKMIERSPYADQIGYEIIINADEEIGSHGSAPTLVEAAKRAHFACVFEPALVDGSLAGARKGSGNFAVTFSGRAAHAGREHHLGVNAISAAAEFAAHIHTLSGSLAGERDGLTVNVARIDGGGPNNVVPDNAVVRFNVRVNFAEDGEWFMAQLQDQLDLYNQRDGLSVESHGSFYRPPKPMDAKTQKFFEAVRAIGADLGLTVKWAPTGGCCDGNNIAQAGIPVVDTLGVRGGNIHSADEFVKLDSLVERAKLSGLLLMKIAAGDIQNPGLDG